MPDERRRAEVLALAHEEELARADPDGRRRRGAFYTPPDLVAWVLDRVLEERSAGPMDRLLDPACGTGHFLVAAARRLGVRAVHGSDTDAEAVRIARMRLRAEDPTVSPTDLERRVRVADGLTAWRGSEFDAVVGNPPFLGQLRRRTAGQRGDLGAYTDTSAVFLHRALDLVGDGGIVALVQPMSVLGARDAAPVRDAVVAAGAVTAFWSSADPVFAGTSVRTCVPVVRRGAGGATVATWHGPGFRPAGEVPMPAGEWGALAAPAFGIPSVVPRGAGVVGDLAACTADFRDQYYGLVPHVREATGDGAGGADGADGADGDVARLVTSGLIEPARCCWGRRSTRFAKQSWDAPVVDLAGLRGSPLADWARARSVPKVLVAGQGRVIEAVADEHGTWLPSVPVVTAVPHDPDDLWRLLAVTIAPPVTAYAAARYLGTGLTPGSVKVSARQLAALPLPVERTAWDEAAAVLRALPPDGIVPDEKHPHTADPSAFRQGLSRAARLMCAAYDVDGAAGEGVLDWWWGRARLGPG